MSVLLVKIFVLPALGTYSWIFGHDWFIATSWLTAVREKQNAAHRREAAAEDEEIAIHGIG